MTSKNSLSPFEGADVLQATIKVTNAGDGLSEALAVDLVPLHQGDTIYVVLETVVSKITYEPIKDVEALKRVHTLKATAGTIVDASLVAEVMAAQKAKILEAQGVVELEFGGDEPPVD